MVARRKLSRISLFAGALLLTSLHVVYADDAKQPGDAVSIDLPNGGSGPNEVATSLKQELSLAGDYMAGRGVSADPARAAYWYRKAADRGDPGAEVELGYFYLAGIGVAANEQQAAKWFERASASGFPAAKLNLAVLYFKGVGVEKDVNLGLQMLNDLARSKNARAEDYLGLVYFLGWGVPRDAAKAEKWFNKAAAQHNPEGEYAMGTLYSNIPGHAQDLQKAAEYFRGSVNGGYIDAMHSLGLLLVNHPELPQAQGEAVQLLEQSALAGSWQSSLTLGVLARDGRGEAKDLAASYRWFQLAREQGGAKAAELMRADLAYLEQKISSEERSEGEQAAVDWRKDHPHPQVFVYKNGSQSAYFPVLSAFGLQPLQSKLDEGATTH